jgi:3-oxoacyl-[acyl-carrier-protein] synthase-3
MPGFSIASTGSYVPPKIVTNDDLASLGCDSEWIVQRTGIRERRQADSSQASSDLAYAAAMDCLQKAGVEPTDVDLIVVATITPDQFTPSTASFLQRRLGCIAPSFDINAACSGFLYALATAGLYVAGGMARRALVIGSEIMTRAVDPSDKRTYPLFGDGAGAVLLVPTEDPKTGGLDAYTLGVEGCGGTALYTKGGGSRQPLTASAIDAGDQYMKMDGRKVFKWAVRVIEDSSKDLLNYCALKPTEIDHVVMHQANVRILDAAAANVGFAPESIFANLDVYGNTSAASVPLALDELNNSGRLRRGDRMLMCGFGAGLTWGSSILTW